MTSPSSTPVVVSITSLPSRVSLLQPTLQSLLSGDRRPDVIRIILPEKPLRESAEFVVPEFLLDESFHGGVVKVIRIERDFGPGSKLLGTIGDIDVPTCLVLADDDVRYRKDFLKGLVDSQLADRSSSFSYFTYPAGGIRVGQGCDGFSFWSPNLAGIREFFADYVDGSDLMFHDDLWISFFLATRGVGAKSLRHRLDGSTIYDQVHDVNALRDLEGTLDREEMNVREYRALMKRVRISPGRRAAIRSIEFSANSRFLCIRSRVG